MSQISIELLLEESRLWRKYLDKLDRGSYCENASEEYTQAFQITKRYEELIDQRLKFERIYKSP